MSMQPKLSTEQVALVTRWTTAGVGPAEQARGLGLPVSRIAATRRRLVREGRAAWRTPRQPWRSWSTKETDKLIQLIEQGTSYPQIANKLKRTEVSIRLRAKRIGVRITTTKATMSARAVADQLGIPCSKVVSGWIARGWLTAANAGSGRPLWRISWEDLTAFLANPAYWIAWKPDRIPDLALREWAQELRANEEPLLRHAAIAQRYHVGRDTIGQWIDKGWLPAVRYGNRFIPESALAGWVVPIDRATPMNDEWPQGGFETVGRAPGAEFRRRPL